MTKSEYLRDSDVLSFINWIEPKFHAAGSFAHAYQSLKPKADWQCDSIYSAYEKYSWHFKYADHTTHLPETGHSFTDSLELLDRYSIGLRESIANGSDDACKNYCLLILAWGGVLPKNKLKIEEIIKKEPLSGYLQKVRKRLNPETFDMADRYDDIEMNAGFTKIYSLLLDDFVIYDGRVGAALGLLVRLFVEENQLTTIPKPLLFAYGDSRPVKADKIAKGPNRRNPSTALFKFPKLDNTPAKHTENNMRANWLLKAILDTTKSDFAKLEAKKQLRALEAALFMIGYDVKQSLLVV